jgi:hypothetical protein
MDKEILQVLEENWLYLKISRLSLLHRMSCVMWSIRFNHSYLALRFFADFGNNDNIIFSCSICRWLRIRESCLVVRETRIDVVARRDRRTRRAAIVLDCRQWGGIHSQRHDGDYSHRLGFLLGEQEEEMANNESSPLQLNCFASLWRSGRMKTKILPTAAAS